MGSKSTGLGEPAPRIQDVLTWVFVRRCGSMYASHNLDASKRATSLAARGGWTRTRTLAIIGKEFPPFPMRYPLHYQRSLAASAHEIQRLKHSTAKQARHHEIPTLNASFHI